MEEFKLKDDFIKLGQLLKASNLVSSGSDAKLVIEQGKVSVNGTLEYQRGKKLRDGDRVVYENHEIIVKG